MGPEIFLIQKMVGKCDLIAGSTAKNGYTKDIDKKKGR